MTKRIFTSADHGMAIIYFLQSEDLHRGLKQLTGTEKCQHLHRTQVQVCRKGRSQRNHIACCFHAWLSLKVKAKILGKTFYH